MHCNIRNIQDLKRIFHENDIYTDGLKLISNIKTFISKYQNETRFEQYPSLQKAIIEIQEIIE